MYGSKTLRKSAMNIRAGAGVIEWAMSGKGYKRAVEIGTYKGCATAEIAQYCNEVITIDLSTGKLEQNRETWDRNAFWKSLGIDNITFCPVANNAQKAGILEVLDFDFAFVDGDHTKRGVALDFSLVKKCGHVLFHDADDNGPGRPNDVYEFLQTLPAGNLEYKDIFALWTADNKK
jgi:predicted O-methyltransferase YrrM